MSRYVRCVLTGLVVAILGTIVWEVGIWVWLGFRVRQQMAALGDSGGLGAASIGDPVLVVFIGLFLLGCWMAYRRHARPIRL